jgi:hypothetical protein
MQIIEWIWLPPLSGGLIFTGFLALGVSVLLDKASTPTTARRAQPSH